MRSTRGFRLIAGLGCTLLVAASLYSQGSGQAPTRGGRGGQPADPNGKIYPAPKEDAYLRWPLPASDESYGRIDGARVKAIMEEITAISRKDRDAGTQFWGRNAGTPTDKETQQLMLTKFKEAGLSDVHLQEFDLPAHWYPASWDASVTSEGKVTALKSLRPFLWSVGTPPAGVDLDAVWVGLGTPADFMGRDVKGKAVFIYSVPTPGMKDNSALYSGAMKRAGTLGAAAVVVDLGFPGNVASEMISHPDADMPTFSVGTADATAVREMIEQGHAPKVHIRLDVQMPTGQKTASIWGTLPGSTDEDILIMAHTDAFFDGALDNASGMATMVALAEYFSKIPQAQRRRTIHFVGVPAHHLNEGLPPGHERVGSQGTAWMVANKDTFFAKTALIINCEHTAQTEMQRNGADLFTANETSPRPWTVRGSDAFKKLTFGAFAEFGVPTLIVQETSPGGELGPVYRFAPSLQLIDRILYHTELDTDEYVPASGLESVTRAYAKIIDEVNNHDIKDLQPTEPEQPTGRGR